MNTNFVVKEIMSETCCECGLIFGMEKEYRQKLIDTGKSFSCPNGHKQHYTNSIIPRLEKRIKYLKGENKRLRANLAHAKASRAALKGHLTRAHNRTKTHA